MIICPITDIYTFTSPISHQGGESFTATVTKFGSNGTLDVDTYNPLTTTVFTFTGILDGSYNFRLEGTVSGLVLSEDFLVDHNARRTISQISSNDVENMICDNCGDNGELYILVKALFASAPELLGCGDMILASDALEKIETVSKGECSNQICAGGCK